MQMKFTAESARQLVLYACRECDWSPAEKEQALAFLLIAEYERGRDDQREAHADDQHSGEYECYREHVDD
jgi:hypothetical protein